MRLANWQKATVAPLVFFLFICFSRAAFGVSPSVVESPDSVEIGGSFLVKYTVSGGDSGGQYYVKIRLGEDDGNLDRGETYNPITNWWLGDTSTWTNFPTITLDSNGQASGEIQSRAKTNAVAGINLFKLRLRNVSSGTNTDSSASNIILVVLPTPTPTEAEVPTPTSVPPSITPSPTLTLTPVPTDYNNIYIVEFLPDPESGGEKVEIKNANDISVSLQGWQIDDVESGGHSPITFSATISPSGLYVLDLGTGFLNNDGDTVRLLNHTGQEKDKREYTDVVSGKSWGRDRNSSWCLLDPSFGADNPDCPADPTSTPTSTPIPTKTPTPSINSSPVPSVMPTDDLEAVVAAVVSPDEFRSDVFDAAVLGVSDEVSGVPERKKVSPVAFAIIAAGVLCLFLGLFSYHKQKHDEK